MCIKVIRVFFPSINAMCCYSLLSLPILTPHQFVAFSALSCASKGCPQQTISPEILEGWVLVGYHQGEAWAGEQKAGEGRLKERWRHFFSLLPLFPPSLLWSMSLTVTPSLHANGPIPGSPASVMSALTGFC